MEKFFNFKILTYNWFLRPGRDPEGKIQIIDKMCQNKPNAIKIIKFFENYKKSILGT